jgi:L-ornithine N5-oxygenase
VSTSSLLIEQDDDVVWQRGMLLPWAESQVSFLKDLVTLRNPRSRFTFLNYLSSMGRLDDFINLATFTPFRTEISDYLRWVAESLGKVRIEYGRRCLSVQPVRLTDGEVRQWSVLLDDDSRIVCENLVIGAGRDPCIPPQLAGLPQAKVIHSTEFAGRMGTLDPDVPLRITVIGGAQSAAEMLWTAHQGFPKARCTMVMRSIGLNNYETSKFTNELFYPGFVDVFYAAEPEARVQLLSEMHRTNYSGLNPSLLENLYRQMYVEKLNGAERIQLLTMTELVAAEMDGADVLLTLRDRKSGRRFEHRCDVVLLGTGFVKEMPKVVKTLAATVGVDTISVNRAYRMALPPEYDAGCYLQGVNEATHGIADSLMSVLAIRSAEIVTDLLEHRGTPAVTK